VALDGLLPAAASDLRRALAQLSDERLHPPAARLEEVGVALDLRGENGHVLRLASGPDQRS